MPHSTAQRRFVRAMIGIVGASGLVYPMVLCAVELVFAQLLSVDVVAIVLWLLLAVGCSVALVGALRWGAARPIRSPWLLAGLVPPALYELWLVWPALTG
jgi:hypothetical protein